MSEPDTGTVARAYRAGSPRRPAAIAFRDVVAPDDFPFLADLYASTREQELAPVDWPADAKRDFLHQQFQLQHDHYTRNYRGADLLMILRDGVAIGRVYVYRSPAEIRLMDIALLAHERGGGLGTAMLHELMDEARATRSAITLHVEPNNPATRLYERLGFSLVENRGVYVFLGWSPPGGPPLSSG